MTQLAVIAPISSADLINFNTPYNLFFAEGVLRDERYARFWAGNNAPVRIMDCMIHEGKKPPSPEELLLAAQIAHPTHICIPDVLRDGEATLTMFHRYKAVLDEESWNLIAVPHGLNFYEIVDNALRLANFGETNYLGLNPGIADELNLRRGDIVAYLIAKNPHLKFHMLGIPKSGFDFTPQLHIMGVDSARPVYQGVVGSHVINRPVHYLEWNRWIIAQKSRQIDESIARWKTLLTTCGV